MTNGPFMGLFFFGIACLTCPEDSFGPGHIIMFEVLRPKVWGILSLVVPALGYYGLFSNKKSFWLWANSLAVFALASISIGFAVAYLMYGLGGPTVAGLSAGIALNAVLRAEDRYSDPFPNGQLSYYETRKQKNFYG